MKGSSIAEEIETHRDALERWRCAEPEVTVLGEDEGLSPTTVVRVAWADPAQVSWPLATNSKGRRTAPRARSASRRRRGG
jgi:16S rRNA (guanine527-N7)-methyltransferase